MLLCREKKIHDKSPVAEKRTEGNFFCLFSLAHTQSFLLSARGRGKKSIPRVSCCSEMERLLGKKSRLGKKDLCHSRYWCWLLGVVRMMLGRKKTPNPAWSLVQRRQPTCHILGCCCLLLPVWTCRRQECAVQVQDKWGSSASPSGRSLKAVVNRLVTD